MEQVVYRLHLRFARSFCYFFPRNSRTHLEKLSLFNAFICLCLLIYLHSKFVATNQTLFSCFGSHLHQKQISFKQNETLPDVYIIVLENNLFCGNTKHTNILCESASSSYLFSLQKGYLLLPQVQYFDHNVKTLTVNISSRCFESFAPLSWLLDYIIGYDVIVVNYLLSAYEGRGFLLNKKSKEITDLFSAAKLGLLTKKNSAIYSFNPEHIFVHTLLKASIALTSMFLFFTSTTLVNFTLRSKYIS